MTSPGKTAVHSVRCSDEVWQAAKQKAEAEGWTVNAAVSELLLGYATRHYHLTDTTIDPRRSRT